MESGEVSNVKPSVSPNLSTCACAACSDTPVAELENHGERVPRVAFHPSGDYLGSTWSVL